jgi:hypothetical protein
VNDAGVAVKLKLDVVTAAMVILSPPVDVHGRSAVIKKYPVTPLAIT